MKKSGAASAGAALGAVALSLSGVALLESLAPKEGTRPGGGSGVSSVTNSDGTLTISPNTGAVVASLNLNEENTSASAYPLQFLLGPD